MEQASSKSPSGVGAPDAPGQVQQAENELQPSVQLPAAGTTTGKNNVTTRKLEFEIYLEQLKRTLIFRPDAIWQKNPDTQREEKCTQNVFALAQLGVRALRVKEQQVDRQIAEAQKTLDQLRASNDRTHQQEDGGGNKETATGGADTVEEEGETSKNKKNSSSSSLSSSLFDLEKKQIARKFLVLRDAKRAHFRSREEQQSRDQTENENRFPPTSSSSALQKKDFLDEQLSSTSRIMHDEKGGTAPGARIPGAPAANKTGTTAIGSLPMASGGSAPGPTTTAMIMPTSATGSAHQRQLRGGSSSSSSTSRMIAGGLLARNREKKEPVPVAELKALQATVAADKAQEQVQVLEKNMESDFLPTHVVLGPEGAHQVERVKQDHDPMAVGNRRKSGIFGSGLLSPAHENREEVGGAFIAPSAEPEDDLSIFMARRGAPGGRGRGARTQASTRSANSTRAILSAGEGDEAIYLTDEVGNDRDLAQFMVRGRSGAKAAAPARGGAKRRKDQVFTWSNNRSVDRNYAGPGRTSGDNSSSPEGGDDRSGLLDRDAEEDEDACDGEDVEYFSQKPLTSGISPLHGTSMLGGAEPAIARATSAADADFQSFLMFQQEHVVESGPGTNPPLPASSNNTGATSGPTRKDEDDDFLTADLSLENLYATAASKKKMIEDGAKAGSGRNANAGVPAVGRYQEAFAPAGPVGASSTMKVNTHSHSPPPQIGEDDGAAPGQITADVEGVLPGSSRHQSDEILDTNGTAPGLKKQKTSGSDNVIGREDLVRPVPQAAATSSTSKQKSHQDDIFSRLFESSSEELSP
ncbi:unnamed protein product [Amoebophrya sp. A120]|nr:unnamed protein product [Amoebophrya sp. A120]|eukprot:GSA120T00002104001.1